MVFQVLYILHIYAFQRKMGERVFIPPSTFEGSLPDAQEKKSWWSGKLLFCSELRIRQTLAVSWSILTGDSCKYRKSVVIAFNLPTESLLLYLTYHVSSYYSGADNLFPKPRLLRRKPALSTERIMAPIVVIFFKARPCLVGLPRMPHTAALGGRSSKVSAGAARLERAAQSGERGLARNRQPSKHIKTL